MKRLSLFHVDWPARKVDEPVKVSIGGRMLSRPAGTHTFTYRDGESRGYREFRS